MENKSTCPYCGEEIEKGTKKCPHCDEWLGGDPTTNDEQTIKRGHISLGIIGGILAGIVSIILWCLIANWIGMVYGYYALGTGAIVGFAVRWVGRGNDKRLGITASICAVVSVLISDGITCGINWMGILFCAMAAVEAYVIAIKKKDNE